MAFASLFTAPTTAPAGASSGWGGLFGNISPAQIAQRDKAAAAETAAASSKAAATKANSVSGLLRATIAGLPSATGIGQMASGSFNLAKDALVTARTGGSTTGGLKEGFDVVSGVGGAALSPLAPVINPVSALFNKFVNVSGNIGNTLASGAQAVGLMTPAGRAKYDKANSAFAAGVPETVTRILQTAQSAGNASMAILGAKAGEAKAPVKLPVRDLSPVETPIDIRRPISVQGTSETTPVNIYHPATPTNELPTIPFGKAFKAKSDLPTIEAGTARTPTPRAAAPGLRYEPVRAPEAPRAVAERPTPVEAPRAVERPVVNGQRVTKAASDIAENLARQGFDRLPPEEQARYTPSTKVEQLSKVAAVMRDPEKAIRIASGEETLPAGIHAPAFFNAVEAHVQSLPISERGEIFKTMAKSPMAARTTLAGQELGSAAFNKNDYGPVSMIRKVQEARTGGRQNVRRSEAVTRRVRTVIKKTNTRESWQSFVESITC